MVLRNKKLTALFLVFLLIINSCQVSAEESCDDKFTLTEAILEEVRELSLLEADKDYVDGEGVFLADSLREAGKIAKSYDARLISYENGVARASFSESTIDTLYAAATSGKAAAFVEPNYVFQLFEDEDEADLTTAAQDPFSDSSSPYYQYEKEMICIEEAHKSASGNGIRVAVIDTGVNPYHEDLLGKVSVNYISRKECRDAQGIDSHGHGTHVCGLIGAIKDNGLGGYGVAPGVSIDSIQVTVTGKDFTLSDVAEAMKMALDLGDDVISMSLGSASRSEVLRQIIGEAAKRGVVIAAAAGNGKSTVKNYPAAEMGVIAVGAVARDGTRASFSSYGKWVNVTAPGSMLYSTYIYAPSNKNMVSGNDMSDSYGRLSGTSQATPLVSGTAALILSSDPGLFKDGDVRSTLLIQEAICGFTDGKGILRVDKAMEFISGIKSLSDLTLIDSAGHYSSILAGQVCQGKTVKLHAGDRSGKRDKALEKRLTWTSSDTEIASVVNGKITARTGAEPGSTALITAKDGEEKAYFVVEVKEPVKKFAAYQTDMKNARSSVTVEKKVEETVDISDPCSATLDHIIYNFSEYKKKDVNNCISEHSTYADGRYGYKIKMSKGDLKKVEVLKTDTNGDPVLITLKKGGNIRVKYALLDGSKKKFTLKIHAL